MLYAPELPPPEEKEAALKRFLPTSICPHAIAAANWVHLRNSDEEVLQVHWQLMQEIEKLRTNLRGVTIIVPQDDPEDHSEGRLQAKRIFETLYLCKRRLEFPQDPPEIIARRAARLFKQVRSHRWTMISACLEFYEGHSHFISAMGPTQGRPRFAPHSMIVIVNFEEIEKARGRNYTIGRKSQVRRLLNIFPSIDGISEAALLEESKKWHTTLRPLKRVIIGTELLLPSGEMPAFSVDKRERQKQFGNHEMMGRIETKIQADCPGLAKLLRQNPTVFLPSVAEVLFGSGQSGLYPAHPLRGDEMESF